MALGLLVLGSAGDASPQNPARKGVQVRGRVLDSSGKPVVRTRVIAVTDGGEMLGSNSDDTGRFFVDCPIGKVVTLLALQQGRMPAELDLGAEQAPRPDGSYMLTIGGEAGHIAGHVLDANGAPLADWNVAALDERPIWALDYQLTLEEWNRGEKGEIPKVYAKTAADGSFRIDGLVKAAYDLIAWDPRTFANVVASGVERSAPDARITLPAETFVRDFNVRVVGADGSIVPDARCSIGLRTGPTHRIFLGARRWTKEADGSLRFPVFPLGSATLQVDGERIRPVELSTTQVRQSGPDVHVEKFTPFRVHVTAALPVRIFAFDAAGVPLGIRVANAGSAGLASAYDLAYPISEILEAGGTVARVTFHALGPQREVGPELCSVTVLAETSGVLEIECL